MYHILEQTMGNETILVVDDEPTILEVVELYLRREGFQVITAMDGTAALQAYRKQTFDLIVLDLMLPGVNGLEVLRQIRSERDLPIIMLTARGEETDRVVGLELGADDYVTKPFSNRELVARVKAVLRRTQSKESAQETHILSMGDLQLDTSARTVALSGHNINLTAREFDLLAFFMRHPGQVFTREQLLDNVWGYTFASDMSTVTVHIRRLREKIEHDPTNPIFLQTVWGIGYKLERM
ncbi:MAG: response regulator transcription factor [Chloroflexi bacterium AL-W]|nr:response regulator transcription factor [Chloroflexi bacterium AL-N1]NOK71454.1 response regulator transcription factor [Chloroflexi bacterium AL-N10]NOK77235.1 response regulator transcription factor [Chloroflexi bacterium AL-N5]NOK86275.1 response regulator transcription factor [Chloroflexi bacterium AL-W]NOK93245.1 response regulator transcription factor [Chloroflexi bacterium AL-N15]